MVIGIELKTWREPSVTLSLPAAFSLQVLCLDTSSPFSFFKTINSVSTQVVHQSFFSFSVLPNSHPLSNSILQLDNSASRRQGELWGPLHLLPFSKVALSFTAYCSNLKIFSPLYKYVYFVICLGRKSKLDPCHWNLPLETDVYSIFVLFKYILNS